MAFDKHKAMQMAVTFAQQGKWDKAIAEYQSILRADPRSISIFNTLGDIYLKLGNKAEAINQYNQLGEAYSKDGLYAKATAIYKKIQNVEPQDYKVYMTLGELYFQQGLVGEAKAQYLAAANYLDRTNQKKEALEVYQKIADLEPSNFTVRVKIGEMYLKEKMVSQAAEQFMRVAQGYIDNGQREEARPYLLRVAQLDPQNLEARKALAQIYLERGEAPQAAEILEPLAQAAPQDLELLTTLGGLYLQMRQADKARLCLEKVIAQDPAHQEAHHTLGRLYLALQNYDAAFSHLNSAAQIMAAAGQPAAAKELYQEILNQNPRYVPARIGLAELLVGGGEGEKALSEYKIAAGLYREAGRNQEAAGFYRQVLKIKPDDMVAQKGLEALKEAPAMAEAPQAEEAVEEPTVLGLEEELVALPGELDLPVLEEISLEPEAPAAAPAAAVEAEGEEAELTFKLEPSVDLEAAEAQAPSAAEELELVSPLGTLEGALEDELTLEEGVKEYVEEDPVIAENLIEADVYLKYGLTDRAVDLLRGIIDKSPHQISPRLKLKKIYQDKGQRDLVLKESLAVAEIFIQKGERALAEGELKEVLLQDPGNSLALLRLKALKEPAPPPPPPVPSELGLPPITLQAAPPPVKEAEPPAIEEPFLEEISPAVEKLPAIEALPEEMMETLEGVPLELLEPDEIPRELLPPAGATVELGEAPVVEIELLGEPGAAAQAEVSPPAFEEELHLARFYRQQGWQEEAREILQNILQAVPQHTEALHELMTLEQTAPPPAEEVIELVGAEPLAEPGPSLALEATPPPSAVLPPPVKMAAEPILASPGELLELMPEIELEPGEVPIPEIPLPSLGLPEAPSPKETRPSPEVTAQFSVAPPVMDTEGGAFVDIGAELEEEMVETSQALPDSKARSLSMDEIFQEFKKGVQQQLSPEDYETHYNLGIAYKEMGLLDEAISEFQLSSKGSNRFIDSSSMLGMCYLEKGMPELAVRQYQKVLARPEMKEEETISMRFDLGMAYEKLGSLNKALESYTQVYGLDAKFRNVGTKISALKTRIAKEGPGEEEPDKKPPGGETPPKGGTPPPEPPPSAGGSKKKVSYV